ncbi:hypothetical protein COO60DRAFT_1496967 [Scenedesmus sp. NREL 46B-D3]|nr:hypothetical protein COO60DRAFT_1496967 [Scenedesmus sp. NREL 46B-D3]
MRWLAARSCKADRGCAELSGLHLNQPQHWRVVGGPAAYMAALATRGVCPAVLVGALSLGGPLATVPAAGWQQALHRCWPAMVRSTVGQASLGMVMSATVPLDQCCWVFIVAMQIVQLLQPPVFGLELAHAGRSLPPQGCLLCRAWKATAACPNT